MADPQTPVLERTPEQMTAYITELEAKHENLNKALSAERAEKQDYKGQVNKLLENQQTIEQEFKKIQLNPTLEGISFFLGVPQDKLTQKEQKILAHLEEGEPIPKNLADAFENLNKKVDDRFAQLSAKSEAESKKAQDAIAGDKYNREINEIMKEFPVENYPEKVRRFVLTGLVASSHPSFGGVDPKVVAREIKEALGELSEVSKKAIVLTTKEVAEKQAKSTVGGNVSLEGDKSKQTRPQNIRDIFGKDAISDLEKNFKILGVG